ncbi:MAG TPA: helix-turn-helix domain-containing protein [Candidatus Dormibacteraeota bacterium]|nr:helix-turn-helix domain-containing protein [Candidatus Dormibacteraeota bacterium]
MPRPYDLGKRRHAVDRTAASVVSAARQLVAEGGGSFAIGSLAHRAGVSRATVYNRFGSKAGVLEALRPRRVVEAVEAGSLSEYIERSCAAWAADPALFRNLGSLSGAAGDAPRRLAETLAASDALRPGCSLKEAEDVIAILTSFAVFDRLHRDGRRSTAAVVEVLGRLAAAILA